MYFCRLCNKRKREKINKVAVFLAVIWFTVCWGLKGNIWKRNLIWCSFVGYTDLPLFSKVNTWNITEHRSSATHINSPKSTLTAWKVFKYGFISVPYFLVFQLSTGKYGPEINPYLDTFHAVKSTDMLWMTVTVIKFQKI